MSNLIDALQKIQAYKTANLANRIATLEYACEAKTSERLAGVLASNGVSPDLLRAALEVKRAAAQIDEVVHSVGTLLCLPQILEPGEIVISLSLGAGNTGRAFDLETDRRIAEFTFIDWKGGPESIRKQKLFKDFYCLVEAQTDKKRFLFVIGDIHAQKSLISRSPCKGMLRKFADLQRLFIEKHGETVTVREFYEQHKALVEIVNLSLKSEAVAAAYA